MKVEILALTQISAWRDGSSIAYTRLACSVSAVGTP